MSSHTTLDQVEDALRKHRGLVSKAAEALGLSDGSVRERISRHPRLQVVLSEARERRVDAAEYRLDQAIENGEAWSIALVLKTIGKDRGYVERNEITGKDGADLVIREVVVHEPDAGGSPT